MSVCHQADRASVKDKLAGAHTHPHPPLVQAGETRSLNCSRGPPGRVPPTGQNPREREALPPGEALRCSAASCAEIAFCFQGSVGTGGSYGGLWQPLPTEPTVIHQGEPPGAQMPLPFLPVPKSQLFVSLVSGNLGRVTVAQGEHAPAQQNPARTWWHGSVTMINGPGVIR